MDKLIEKVLNILHDLPEIDYEYSDDSIIVIPQGKNGFPVSLKVHDDNHFTVGFDLWHEEFDNEDEALKCFTFGFSRECRLKITKRGNRAYKWTVEYKDSESWKEDSTTGLFIFRFWRKKTYEYLQNDLL